MFFVFLHVNTKHMYTELTLNIDKETIEQAEILMKYEGYIERERENAEKQIRLEEFFIKPEFNYNSIKSLGAEAIEKFNKYFWKCNRRFINCNWTFKSN